MTGLLVSFVPSYCRARNGRATIGHARDAGLRRALDTRGCHPATAHLGLSTDAVIGRADNWKRPGPSVKLADNRLRENAVNSAGSQTVDVEEGGCLESERERRRLAAVTASNDPDVLRAALVRESCERRRAECRADMQTSVAKLALDLLVREPDVDGFFGALTRTMVEEGESHACALWLLDEAGQRCEPWMAYVEDHLLRLRSFGGPIDPPPAEKRPFPCEVMANHLFAYSPGWTQTIEYRSNDSRLPIEIRVFGDEMGWNVTFAAPLMLGTRTLGWMTIVASDASETEDHWWRVALLEAIARQAALALHYSRLVELNRLEERRKATLDERNRLARDIHDTLAQGFAAILMQLQGAQREAGALPPTVAKGIETAIDLARLHLTEARRSVGTLRPNVASAEDIATSLKRLAETGRRTASMPIELEIDEIPRLGDGVEREIVGIAQEALTNAVRHSRARRITIRASTVQSVGLRLSITDDGRGIVRDATTSGFGMTSMQERADRIGASLTIVTAPRHGTEIVLAWEPSSLPTQVHAAS
jgi:signal transduction histidine kinase